MIYFIISVFLFLIISIFIALNFSKNDLKGKIGEFYVYCVLKILLGKNYYVLNDLNLPRPGKTNTQIDHIVVGPTGVYVVETKNMRGEIVGRTESAYWAQIFSMFDRRSFLSPIIQNDIHVNAVKRVLPVFRNTIFNCVVFVNNKTIDLSKDLVVFDIFALVRHIKAGDAVLTAENIKLCKDSVLLANIQNN